jgi:predicted metal-dependent hydrolase
VIKRQRASFERQDRESQREMVSGQSHYHRGRRYRLQVVEMDDAPRVELRAKQTLLPRVRPGTTGRDRARLLQGWYRERLRDLFPRLLDKWQDQLGVAVPEWGIKRMKTKWGSCDPKAAIGQEASDKVRC